MKLDLVGTLRSAWARLRADHAMLLPVAGLTLFLPQLALLLLLDAPVLEKGDGSTAATTAQTQALLDWMVRNSGWYLAAYLRSEEHTSELQSLMRISYAVFCLK